MQPVKAGEILKPIESILKSKKNKQKTHLSNNFKLYFLMNYSRIILRVRCLRKEYPCNVLIILVLLYLILLRENVSFRDSVG